MPARSIAARTTCPPIVAPWVMFSAPRQDFARPVRAVDTMTASRMIRCPQVSQPLNPLPSAARRASNGAGVQNAASPCGFAAKSAIRLTTL
ncbi:MAG: hypothetical protein GHHEDOFH_02344 [Pseudorhodoplanes sp.]|nr:hypothetical protein [Pseudorhodoplanes sp.]